MARVASSLTQTRYVFLEKPPRWQEVPWSAMSEAEQREANEAWRQAESAAVHSHRSEQDDIESRQRHRRVHAQAHEMAAQRFA